MWIIVKRRISFFYGVLEKRIQVINHQPSMGINEIKAEALEKSTSSLKEYKFIKINEPRIILDKPFHLSYPFIIQDNDHIFMLPEQSQSQGLMLYIATDFPHKWTEHKLLINRPQADSTILYHNNVL